MSIGGDNYLGVDKLAVTVHVGLLRVSESSFIIDGAITALRVRPLVGAFGTIHTHGIQIEQIVLILIFADRVTIATLSPSLLITVIPYLALKTRTASHFILFSFFCALSMNRLFIVLYAKK